jgi:tetratricopeptide (TPR) repeat protein
MKLKILILSLLFLGCKKEKSRFVVVSRKPLIEYVKDGNNILIYDSNFKLGKANDLNRAGLKLMEENNSVEARKRFIKALAIEPDNPVILNNLGNLEFKEFQFKKAIEYCQKALVVSDSTYTIAGHNLGKTYGLIGEDKKSEEVYKFIIKKTKSTFLKGITYYNLADMYLEYGEIDKSYIALSYAKRFLSKYKDFKEELEKLELKLQHYYD